jgi:hypothetical protein
MCSKNTSSMSLEMCKKLSLFSRISLLQQRIAIEENHERILKDVETKDALILYSFSYAVDALKDELLFNETIATEKDCPGLGCYVVDFNSKEFQKKSRVKPVNPAVLHQSQFLHPYLTQQQFSRVLFHEADSELQLKLARFNCKKHVTDTTGLQLLSHIICEGNETFGVKRFKITSNQSVANNRQDFVTNQNFVPVFSCVMVRYETKMQKLDEEYTNTITTSKTRAPKSRDGNKDANDNEKDLVVRVMAIVRLVNTTLNWKELGNVVLIVARMTRSKPTRGSNMPYERLSYSLDDTSNMQFDVIDPCSIRQPVCVIPEFSRQQTVCTLEKQADRVNRSVVRNLKFLLIPNNSLIDAANIGLVDGNQQTHNKEPDDINSLVLSRRNLETLNIRISNKEVAVDSDDSEKESNIDDSDRYDDMDEENKK